MKHPHLSAFFNGVHDMLLAAFEASDTMSDESRGAVREVAVFDVLTHVLPPMARVEVGDIIDAEGNRSGQLDGVVLDSRSPTLRWSPRGSGFFLAEGVVAVVELKSDLCRQASQVVRLVEHIAPLRRSTEGVAFGQGAFEERIPLLVLARGGWASPDGLLEHVVKLREAYGGDAVPPIFAFTLKQPMRAGIVGTETVAEALAHDHRGAILAEVWWRLSAQARAVAVRDIPFESYFRCERWAPRQIQIPMPAMPSIPRPEDL